ncbi:MAG: rod shape-determining protein RodA [Pseudohongiellaceae bacterium]
MAEILRRASSERFRISGPERTLAWQLHLDLPLLLAIITTCAAGLAVLYSASGEDSEALLRQAVRISAGLLGMFLLAQVPPRTYRYWAVPVFVGVLVSLVLVLLIGVEANGARRWLAIPGVGRFQPSELMKLALPVMLAWYLSRGNLPPRLPQILVCLLLIGIPVMLIGVQPDLGTAVLLGSAGVVVLFFAGLSWRIISLAGLGMMVAAPLMYLFVLEPYQRRRVDTLFNPEADPLGAGWNIIQSKIAIGSGGLSGKGWLNGTQSRLDFLPESSTDFILAVIGEEFGLLGIVALVAIYLFIVARGMHISWQAGDSFGRLVGISLSMVFLVYVVVNMAMVSGLLPVVGIPLPLISYGGTSIITLLAGFGVLMSIHTHKRLLQT